MHIEDMSSTTSPNLNPATKQDVDFGEYLEFLAVIGHDFASSLDIDDTLNKALNRIVNYMDAEAAWHHLIAKAGVAADRILVCGLSLGGPMAAHLASQFDPRGLILEATFTSIPDLAADLYPMFPARKLTRFRYSTITESVKLAQYDMRSWQTRFKNY